MRLAADYFLVFSILDATGAFFEGLDVLQTCLRLRVCTCFSMDFRYSAPRNAKFFRPRGGARTELALQTRENRWAAELVEPAKRLRICSRSKKSATILDTRLAFVFRFDPPWVIQ